jgi:protein involved in polysaccharide export with SLBB domain
MADVPDKQIKRLRALIQEAETNLAAANELLVSLVGDDERIKPIVKEDNLGKVIEGVFDGQNMVGSDGKMYPIPANYASKSKLVQGDILKLTIADDGAFLYKQIGPIPRKQVVGTLKLEGGHYFVEVGSRDFRVLLASVTYFKAKPGDQVSVNVPEDDTNTEWAALEAAL